MPVDQLPVGGDPIFLTVAKLQVIRMLPHIDHQDRQRSAAEVVLVIESRLDQEPPPERIPGKHAPAGALYRRANRVELCLERRERTEVPVARLGEVAIGPAASVR